MQPFPNYRIRPALLDAPRAVAEKIRRGLGPHPVPQSDPRTRGLLVEMNASEAHRVRLRNEIPALAEVLDALGDRKRPLLVLAVNESPPTNADAFFMMPHVDRRYGAEGFARATPERTTVVMLDFPDDGVGGELVAFDAACLRDHPAAGRYGARAAAAEAGGQLLPPVPGTAYELAGDQPHAVLGYEMTSGAPWRMVVVIAEFTAVEEREAEWRRLG